MSKKTVHELKILPVYFDKVRFGEKRFEIRKDDREYKVGDILRLKEWDVGYYTGEEIDVAVRYILHDYEFPDGIKPGYCIMAIDTMV